jgi:hypothetical protein
MDDEALASIHSNRAMAELEMGLWATSLAASIAHLKVSSLHVERSRHHRRVVCQARKLAA